jgi:hypothetical protein
MTTTDILAGRIWADIKRELPKCDHSAEIICLLKIEAHLDAYHAELVKVISMGATNLLPPPNADHKTSSTHLKG